MAKRRLFVKRLSLTEIVNVRWDPNDPKVPFDKLMGRKNYNFVSLKRLAEFSRRKYIYVYCQKNTFEPKLRTNDFCEVISRPGYILFIDIDEEFDLKRFYERLKKKGILGFGYRSSAFYREGEHRARIGIVTKDRIPIGGAKPIAYQVLEKIGYELHNVKIDTHIFGAAAYLAPVFDSSNHLVQNYDEKGQSLYVNEKGKPFEYDSRRNEKMLKTKVKTAETKQVKKKDLPSKFSKLEHILRKFNSIRSVTARGNKTITVEFKRIQEETEGGYYINPYEDPWRVFHPNPFKKPFYINEELSRKEFIKYRKTVWKLFKPKDVLSSYTKPDDRIKQTTRYLDESVFDVKTKILLIESPTGTGKTSSLSEWVKMRRGSILIISINQQQALQTKRTLEQKGVKDVVCYLDNQIVGKNNKCYPSSKYSSAAENIPKKFICNILSLHHLINNGELIEKYKTVIIDEVSTLPSAAINTLSLVGKEACRFKNDMLALYKLFENAEKIICLDGYVSYPIIRAIKRITRGKKESQLISNHYATEKKVQIYLTAKANKPNFRGQSSEDEFMKKFEKDSIKHSNGKGMLVVGCTEKKKAKELCNYLKIVHDVPKSNVLLIDSDSTKEPKFLEKLRNLPLFLSKETNYLVYSPSITAGVDIPEAKNSNVYTIVNGKHLSAHTIYQMTMRGRDAAHYRVLFPKYLSGSDNSLDIANSANRTSKERFIQKFLQFIKPLDLSVMIDNEILISICKKRELGMGAILLFRYFQENQRTQFGESGDRSIKEKVIEHLRGVKWFNLIRDPAVKTALALEFACIEWKLYDEKYGVLGQYVNLLKREGCRISVELDEKAKLTGVKNDHSERLLKEITETLKYAGPLPELKERALYNFKKQLVTAQRMLDYSLNEYSKAPEKTKNTFNLLEKAFRPLGLSSTQKKFKPITIYNIQCERMIDDIITLVSAPSTIEAEIARILKNCDISDRKKLAGAKKLISLFFEISRKSKNDKHFYVKPNQNLLKSISEIDNEQIKMLYI